MLGGVGGTAIAKALETNTTITAVNLCWNRLGSGEGCGVALARVLEGNKTLTSLNLRYNQLGERCIRMIAKALETNNTLTTLSLDGNGMGEACGRAIASVCFAFAHSTYLIVHCHCCESNVQGMILTEHGC
eukprot:c20695_g1_i4.p1 GENE.c20695_g1_i4~~c20695_g1_i4.p1  ORF type:complete len:131 (+),score=22.49 c20695_g1_i4:141-533(+)